MKRDHLGGLASAGVVIATGLLTAWPARHVPPSSTALVREAPFTEVLVEQGTVTAARMLLYSSTIAGAQAKIVDLAPEGSAVAPGDVLVRFDAAPFEEAVQRERASVAQADAELLRAEEDLRLEQMRVDADREAAREQLGAAETALASERQGRGPLALAEAEVALNQASRERTQAQTTAGDMRALLTRGFVTRTEVDRAEQTLGQAEDRERLARLRLQALTQFEQPAALDKSQADVSSARKAIENSTEAGRARLAQRRAAVTLAQTRAGEARARLARANDQVERTTLRSATAGLVVYRELFFGTDKRKPQPGDEVWPSQALVAVPDPAQLVIETRVREVDLHKLAASQHVTVSVDAYPGVKLDATVSTIGALALEDPARAGKRFFPVTIKLTRSDDRLRTGMTARVDIETTSMPHALVVPVQAIVERDGVSQCSVFGPHGAVARTVTVLARNELVAAIGSGLSAGETVLLRAIGQ